ncbi:bifunctional folylpolyglutamate synthase/dihydrofolate synthase [Vulcanococcus limneticus]|uniref:bifunctional folylpolyglutamate synthase/dihydrofolate synthase n=1 Tax=Vulcanococcus limneticus TaxID=2170428 RepID=UPI00398C01C9
MNATAPAPERPEPVEAPPELASQAAEPETAEPKTAEPETTGSPQPVDLDDLLEPFASRGMDLGLRRLEGALAAGGHPERRFRAVQVAGTNGKGSIATFLHTILRATGLRCGIYRSPHLVSWCERIQLNDRWIAPATLRADLARWRPIAAAHQLTPFEWLTAAAFDRFALADLDVSVLEVGLGGRLDATTAHPHRPVVGFGAIGLDHCEHLGADLASIAREKAGVLSAGCLAFSAPQDPEVATMLEAEARRLGAELRWVAPLAAPEAGGPELGLPGMVQRSNGAVAVAMARALAERGWPRPEAPLSEAAILAGLAAARWPGRLETRHFRGVPLLLDGAHNPPAAVVLRRELDRLGGGGRTWLIGIQRHKDGAAVLRALIGPEDRALIVPIPDHRAWGLDELAAACPELAGQLASVLELEDGLQQLSGAAAGKGLPGSALPAVAGSLYLLGAVMPLLDPLPARSPAPTDAAGPGLAS